MITRYDFRRGMWREDDFNYVYSPRFKEYKSFTQEDEYIRNAESPLIDYEYVSIIEKKKRTSGVTVKTRTCFSKYGAPIIVIADEPTLVDGHLNYNLHFELVGWEEGTNVWRLEPNPGCEERPMNFTKVGCSKHPIGPYEEFEMTLKVIGKTIICKVGGVETVVEDENIPDEFYVGITACEGINKFWYLEIED